jgi:16S rRNA processing protein RimM
LTAGSSSGPAIPDDLVLVAHVSGAFGIAGWVRLKPYSAEASALLHAKTWWLDKPVLHDVDVMQVRAQGEDVVARLMGTESRDAAENLRGATVKIRRAHFPPLGDEEFYWVDLIGHEVVNLAGESLGEVVGLIDNGAHPILRVQPQSSSEKAEQALLIPFVDHYVTKVDQPNRQITVDWQKDF